MIRACLLIPHFNHVQQFRQALERFAQCDLPMILVDDGSEPENYRQLQELVEGQDWITLVRLPDPHEPTPVEEASAPAEPLVS